MVRNVESPGIIALANAMRCLSSMFRYWEVRKRDGARDGTR